MGWFTKLRDAVETAAVVGGNYFVPGSSLLTSQLVSEGSKQQLNSDLGRVAQIGSGLAGAGVGADTTGIPASSFSLSDVFGANTAPGTTTGTTGVTPQTTANMSTGLESGTLSATTSPTAMTGTTTAPTPIAPGTVSQASNIPTYGTADPGNYGYDMGGATNVGASPYGSNLPMTGADWEQMRANMPAYSAVNAPLATETPGFLSNLTAGNLGAAANTAWDKVSSNPVASMYVGGSLYDMYAKNQMAKQQQALYQQNRSDVNNMFAPGSAEYNYLQESLARKDAAAGRNSNYAERANNLAAIIAKYKTDALSNMANSQNQVYNTALGNQYGMMNTPLALAALTATQKGK